VAFNVIVQTSIYVCVCIYGNIIVVVAKQTMDLIANGI
jgi:hypothetical protein